MSYALEDFYPDIYPLVTGCSDVLVESTLLNAAVEFCTKTNAVHYDMDAVSVVAGVSEYQFEPPVDTDVVSIVLANMDGDILDVLSQKMANYRFPRHREYNGRPVGIFRMDNSNFRLYPAPDTGIVSGLYLTVALKPTRTATSLPDKLYEEFKDAMVFGTAYRLMSMPNKDWTNDGKAAYYRALFDEQISMAKREATRSPDGATPITRYGGIGGSKRRTRRAYGQR